MNGVNASGTKASPSHLLFDRAVHALEHPYDPASLDHFADEPECPRFGRRIHILLLRPYGEEVLEKPLCDEE
jgi:hypothetical protein